MSTSPVQCRIRWATESDLQALARFFGRAYGEGSVFCSTRFLRWYFRPRAGAGGTRGLNCLIAVGADGAPFSHYGGVSSLLYAHGETLNFLWGVNAFTLPGKRGLGVGGKMAQTFLAECEAYGVIGFTEKTATFYERKGFDIYGRRRFHRYVAPLSEAIFDVAELIGCRSCLEGTELQQPAIGSPGREFSDVRLIRTRTDFDRLRLELDFSTIGLTTMRTPEHLRWRYFDLMEGEYEMWVAGNTGPCRSYVISRREKLVPSGFSVCRIVDLFGDTTQIETVLSSLLTHCLERGDVYLEGALFGERYDEAFSELGFSRLEADEAAWLPQVSCPVEPRPNREYLGMRSLSQQDLLHADDPREIHFTRGDSDRDRLSRKVQLKEASHG